MSSGTVALVQARMGSTRLPGKTLAPLGERPLLAVVIERVRRASRLDGVAVVTSVEARDDVVADLAEREGVLALRGSELDVLDRFHAAALALDAEVIVRVTADCPLVDPELIDRLVALRAERALDYAGIPTGDPSQHRLRVRRWPDGLDAEAITRAALETAWREATEPADREHVTMYVKFRPERFSVAWLECERDLGHERWTVDRADDLEFVRALVDRLGGTRFGYRDVLALLAREPELRALNAPQR